MTRRHRAALGLDFGTESVRALLTGLDGTEHAASVRRYPHGQIIERLPETGEALPPDFALQHPSDWCLAAAQAVRATMRSAGLRGDDVLGIGLDFTSCTMLPARRDGTPLCLLPRWSGHRHAWPKLWKHHGAKRQTDRLNAVARQRREPWLARYGGVIGLEWFFPKVLEVLEEDPAVYHATEVWLEAGDWVTWQLVGGDADRLPRSTCQAGYKAMWNAADGYPSTAFFRALDPAMADVVTARMPGRLVAPGRPAGGLEPAMAARFGLRAGTPVSAAIIDAHAGVPGAGVGEPGTLVMVMGTSSCHMLNARVEKLVPGVAGVVADGILPGYFGYETGQAAVGDAFDWLRRLAGHDDFADLDAQAADIAPGSEGVCCVDWFNGCRTPLMDGSLRGAFTGLTLNHTPAHLYRALLEASAFGLRWIVGVLRDGGVPCRRFVATGGLPHHNPLLVQICADALGQRIVVHPSTQGPALGAAILGVLAAGQARSGFPSASMAMRAMARPDPTVAGREPILVRPRRAAAKIYDRLFDRYMGLADVTRKQAGRA